MAKQPAAPRRHRLSRERVLTTAVALADGMGIEALTMRALAHELGVVPMALYKHVASKDQLLDGMVDIVFAEVDFACSGAGWKTTMRHRAIWMREALMRHRWAIGLMESRLRPGPANLRYHNETMRSLREAGFSFRTALHAYSAMDSYIYGFALQEKTLGFETPEESAEVAESMLATQPPSQAGEYPFLLEVVAELGKAGYDYAVEFEVGLDLLLDGIEQLRPEWTSAAG